MSENRKNIPEGELKELLSGVISSLTDEQKEQFKTCTTLQDFTELAGKLGVALPDEVLDAVAGGTLFESLLLEQGIDIRDSTGQDQVPGDPAMSCIWL